VTIIKHSFTNPKADGADATIVRPSDWNASHTIYGEVDTVADLVADTAHTYSIVSAGDYLRTRKEGFAYEVAASGASDHSLTTAGGVKLYVLPGPDGAYNIMAFGAVADNSTDNYAVFNTAIAYLAEFSDPNDFYARPIKLRFPSGFYYCSDKLIICDGAIHWEGDGSGFQGSEASVQIRWPAGVDGISIEAATTNDYTIVAAQRSGATSILKGLRLYGGGVHATHANGLVLRQRATVVDCQIMNFSGDGINVDATAGVGVGASEGNANLFQFYRVRVSNNGRHGIFVDGADSNAGIGISVDATGNVGYGIKDSSFLGNTWIACHADGNGIYTSGPTGTPSGTYGGGRNTALVVYGGNDYAAMPDSDPADLLSTTPGTDAAVWHFLRVASGGFDGPLSWGVEPDLVLAEGGAYYSNGGNQRTAWIGCYSESGQAPSYLGGKSVVTGGLQAADNIYPRNNGNITLQDGGITPFYVFAHEDDTDASLNIKFRSLADVLIELLSTAGQLTLSYNLTDKLWAWGDTSLGYQASMITDASTNVQCGTGASIGEHRQIFPQGFYLGGTSYAHANARKHSVDSAAPASGAHAAGEIVYNVAPTLGGNIGWVCTTAGTPGTWAQFGNSVLQNTATYDPPSLAAGTVDTIQSMTVTGAALGDMVDASFSLDLQGITLRAWVSATNTVKYVFECAAGGATVDLGSGTVKCRVRK
jgi:hypothetical protein